MAAPIFPRDLVARQLAIAPGVLERYERRGLVTAVRDGEIEGYGPREVRLVWTIVSLQRDLGINLAGVEAILRLRSHMAELHRRVGELAERLNAALEDDLAEPGPP